jgi:hypothetical protein
LDILWTTLWPDGASGPIITRVNAGVWRSLRHLGSGDSRVVSLSGPAATAAALATWLLFVWTGWALVFSSTNDSLVDTSGSGVSLTGRVYFVAYTIFTMGNGDFSPAGGAWQLATSMAAASGMVTITFVVTYVLSAVRTVAKRRSFASSVHGLGSTPSDLVLWAVDSGPSGLDLPVQALAAQLSTISGDHLAFPVLHYFHPTHSRKSTSVAVAVFDDAMTMLEHGVTKPNLSPPVLALARSSVDDYRDTLDGAFIRPADEPPPPPSLDHLRRHGVPVVDEETFKSRAASLGDRRRRLRGAVEADAWPWTTVGAEG